MRTNRLLQAMKEKRTAVGGWVAFADPASAEVMARAGFDWLLVDMEHCPLAIQNVHHILLATQQTETAAIVRPLATRAEYIKQILDLGADGVMVPQINTVADARTAVEAARYQPIGNRAFGPVRAGRYFSEPDYLRTANDYHVLIAQIETVQGLENMESILAVEGIDAVFFGHGDYSQSAGLLGQMRAPEVLAAEERFYELAHKAGMPAGSVAASDEHFERVVELGARIPTRRGDISYVFTQANAEAAGSRKIIEEKTKPDTSR